MAFWSIAPSLRGALWSPKPRTRITRPSEAPKMPARSKARRLTRVTAGRVPWMSSRSSSLPVDSAACPVTLLLLGIIAVLQSVFRVGPHNGNHRLRSLAKTQFGLVEQAIHDVPITLNPVVHELRVAVASHDEQ